MGLTSFFKRGGDDAPAATPVGGSPDAVQQARTRARHRLIGAIVLVGIGIVGFPLVFETQPRPVAVDIPIEVPRKDIAPPLTMPATRLPPVAAAPPTTSSTEPAGKTTTDGDAGDVITESREEAGRPVAEPTRPAAAAAGTTADQTADKRPSAPPSLNDGARARALLEGKTVVATTAAGTTGTTGATATTPATATPTDLAAAPAAGSGAEPPRFVVQVGAFADAAAARETRLKVEQLGLKTYTQVASTAAGSRIRVRVGPFGTRDEADKAFAKARAAGLSAVVLSL